MKYKNVIIRDTAGFSKGFADVEIKNGVASVQWDLYAEKYNAVIEGDSIELGEDLWIDLKEWC